MQNSIRIGIAGYGNLGRGVETAIQKNPDLQLVGIFTRRAPETVSPCFGLLVETRTMENHSGTRWHISGQEGPLS